MRAASPRRRGLRGWRRVDYAAEMIALVGEQLRECGSLGGDGDPVAAHGFYDNQGRLRRLHATYANGWRATLVVRTDGSWSLSQAIKFIHPAPVRKGEAPQ